MNLISAELETIESRSHWIAYYVKELEFSIRILAGRRTFETLAHHAMVSAAEVLAESLGKIQTAILEYEKKPADDR